MMQTIKEKARRLNLKKCFLALVLISIVYAIGAGALLNRTFGARIAETRESYAEQWQQYLDDRAAADQAPTVTPYRFGWGAMPRGTHGFGAAHGFLPAPTEDWSLTTGETALVGAVGILAALLGIAYWLLCLAWAYRKAAKLGTNTALWVAAAVFFHLFAVAALYLWSWMRGTCPQCGRLKQKDARHCAGCGTPYSTACASCGKEVPASAAYCPHCGQEIHHED